MKNINLKRRIIDISYEHRLSHLGSCLTAIDIIDHIFRQKEDDEKFILSAGHAGLALYVMMESIYPRVDAEEFLKLCGIHPDRSFEAEEFVDCSTGSLGQGLPIAVGMALADRSKNVYCLISDGECSEGSIWEALRIAREQNLTNLKVYLNMNGYGAYKTIDRPELIQLIKANGFPVEVHETHKYELPFLNGVDAHYHVMSEQDYEVARSIYITEETDTISAITATSFKSLKRTQFTTDGTDSYRAAKDGKKFIKMKKVGRV